MVISIAIVLGIVIGNYISTKKFTLDKDRKINAVLNLIQSEYVDSIDVKDLVEQAIPAIIGNLDPHSYYIPASDIRAENEKLDGSLSGIGVSFFMMNDTANVDQVIPNGPAEKVGMLAGDRIISVNGESIVGGTLTAEGIRSKIRGEKGTKVRIGVKRNTSKKTLTFTITRDDIPMNTIDVSYMLDDKTGYIKIAQFGKNTYDEFFAALSKLKKDGASRYIVDLRGNPGGYMEMAILMVNEFLEQGELIVYTKGRKEREDIQVWSDDQGSLGLQLSAAGRVLCVDGGHGGRGADRRGKRLVERNSRRSVAGQRPRTCCGSTVVWKRTGAEADLPARQQRHPSDHSPLLHAVAPMHTERLHAW